MLVGYPNIFSVPTHCTASYRMVETEVSKLTLVCFRILLCLIGALGNTALFFFSMPSISCRLEPYKILVINLALSDLITNFMVDIPSILVDIHGTWILGESYCKVFWFTASLSITSSILTTFAMSVFWFYKVVGSTPKNYCIFRQTELRLLGISISLGWLVSIIFSTPLLFFSSLYTLKDDQNKPSVERVFGCRDDFPSNFQKNLYVIIYLLIPNGLPIIGMLFINVKIVLFLIRNRKRIAAMKCTKMNGTSAFNCPVPKFRDQLGTLCQGSEGNNGDIFSSCGAVKDMFFEPPLSSIPLTGTELDFVRTEKCHAKSEDGVKMIIKTVDKRILIQQFLQSLEKKTAETEEHKHPSASIIYDPFMVPHMEKSQKTVLYNLKDSHLVLIPDKDTNFVDGNTDQQMLCSPGESLTAELTCTQDYCALDDKDQPPTETQCSYKTNNRDFLLVKALTTNLTMITQIRSVLTIMAIVSVFSVFWVTYLTVRIKESTTRTEDVVDNAFLVSASYTTIIPYVFIYNLKKLPRG